MVKLGICEWSLPVRGIPGIIKAKEIGFSGFILDLGSSKDGYPLSKKRIQKEYSDLKSSINIEFPTVAVNELCGTGMIHSQNYNKITEIFKTAIDSSYEIGAGILQVPSFVNGVINSEGDFYNTAKCLKFACEYAKGSGLIIGTENTLHAYENKKMLEVVGETNLKVYFDTANPFWLAGGKHAPSMLDEIKNYICEVHFKDVIKDKESNNFRIVKLGFGDTEFYNSAKILQDMEYSGWIHLENDLSFEEITEDYKVMRKLFLE